MFSRSGNDLDEKKTDSDACVPGRNSVNSIATKASTLNVGALSSTVYGDLPATRAGSRFPFFAAFTRSPQFELVVGCVILVNCATIGIEVDGMVSEQSDQMVMALKVLEHIFTVFFLCEFCLRAAFQGLSIYIPRRNGTVPVSDAMWNLMDAGLVWVTGVLFVWILDPLGLVGSWLRVCTALRAFRLFRLVRVVRKMPMFREVCLLIRGLGDSFRTLFWTILVMVFITYIFAVFGVVLLSSEFAEQWDAISRGQPGSDAEVLVQLQWEIGGVDNFMYTLVQVLTLDSWNGIARPIMSYLEWSWVFFYFYIAVAVVVFMNLVTAIIVENALSNSREDEEARLLIKNIQRDEEFKKFRRLFALMDNDGDGLLGIEEFMKAFEEDEVARQLKLLDFKPEDCMTIFGLLDEGDGCLTIDEFFEGLSRMQGEASAKDLFILSWRVDRLWSVLGQLAEESHEDTEMLCRAVGATPPKRIGNVLQRARQDDGTKVKPCMSATRKKGSGSMSDMEGDINADTGGSGSEDVQREASAQARELSPNALGEKLEQLLSGLESLRGDVTDQMEHMSSRICRVEEQSSLVTNAVAALAAQREAYLSPQVGKMSSARLRESPGRELRTPCQDMCSAGKTEAK